MKLLLAKLWALIAALNRSKVVNGIGAFFALAVPVLIVVGQNLPSTWKVTLLIASAVGVLSRAQYIWQKVVPLLDGSSVVQVKPPTVGVLPSLFSVASDTSKVPAVKPAPSEAPTPIEGNPIVRKKDAGRFETLTWAIIVVALVGTLLCLWLIVRPGVARADTPSPQLGGCFANGTLCVSPSVLVPAVIRFDTKESAFQLVPAFGGCYGISYRADQWWSPGADACVSVQLAKDWPNQVIPAVMFKFMGIRAGVDLRLTQQTGLPLDKDLGILFSYGIDLGASPAYMAKQAKAGQAEKAAQEPAKDAR